MKAKTKPQPRVIGVLLRPIDVHTDGTKKVTMEAEIVEIDETGRLFNPLNNAYEYMQVRLVVWDDGGSCLNVQYSRVYTVQEHDAERMFKKLRDVRRKQQKFTETLGDPVDATDSFMRALNAIGVVRVVEKVAGDSCTFSENEYEIYSLERGAACVRHLLREALATLTPPAPAVAETPA